MAIKSDAEEPARASASSGKVELFDAQGKSRGFYSLRNAVNDLTGREWVYWSKSVITKSYPLNMCHDLRNQHGGQKPPDLCADLIQIFTKEGQRVLDPLMGVGGTLLGAAKMGRSALGIDIEERWIKIYKQVCAHEGLRELPTFLGDAREVLKTLEPATFDFVLTDVPYWAMDKLPKSPGRFKRVGQQAQEKIKTALGRFNDREAPTRESWLAEMTEIFRLTKPLLRKKGYLAVFVGDMYRDGEYHCLSCDLMSALKGLGYTLKANLIWYDGSKSLHVYGYQYTFIPSMIHQNILVFQHT